MDLGEYVGELLVSGKICEPDESFHDFFAGKVAVNRNMLGTVMKNGVGSNVKNRVIVTMQGYRLKTRDPKFFKEAD
jgi:hypothetical protein